MANYKIELTVEAAQVASSSVMEAPTRDRADVVGPSRSDRRLTMMARYTVTYLTDPSVDQYNARPLGTVKLIASTPEAAARYALLLPLPEGADRKQVHVASDNLSIPADFVCIADVPIHSAEKVKTPSSRADRLSEAERMVEDAKSAVEELKDEMQQWYDSIPENLQNGGKADEVQAAVDALEELQSNLENCDFNSVEFPGMY